MVLLVKTRGMGSPARPVPFIIVRHSSVNAAVLGMHKSAASPKKEGYH